VGVGVKVPMGVGVGVEVALSVAEWVKVGLPLGGTGVAVEGGKVGKAKNDELRGSCALLRPLGASSQRPKAPSVAAKPKASSTTSMPNPRVAFIKKVLRMAQ
jgi:hypothetical protein